MNTSWTRCFLTGIIAASAIFAGVGCTARVHTPMDGYVYVDSSQLPADIYSYPRAPYGSGYAYWAYDRWYYPSASGWVTLTSEPAVLAPYRTQFRYRYGSRYVPPRYYGPRVYNPTPSVVVPSRPYIYRSSPTPGVITPARPYYYRPGPVIQPSRPYYAPAPPVRSPGSVIVPGR